MRCICSIFGCGRHRRHGENGCGGNSRRGENNCGGERRRGCCPFGRD